MKREFIWKVTLHGVPHEVYCRFAGDRYILYADGVYTAEIMRQSTSTMWYGMEEPVTLFGEQCLFVVWDEKPDLVIDGRLIGRKHNYEKSKKRMGNRILVGYGILLGVCVSVFVLVICLLCLGMGAQMGWIDVLITLAAVTTIGAWSAKQLWRLTHS
jgi:hypothetical protein